MATGWHKVVLSLVFGGGDAHTHWLKMRSDEGQKD